MAEFGEKRNTDNNFPPPTQILQTCKTEPTSSSKLHQKGKFCW